MKLLTWMHRKFRQGTSETMKNSPWPLLDNHVYQRQNNSTGPVRQVHKDGQARQSFTILATKTLGDLEENTSADLPLFFEGFLAIGTLGTDAITNSEPETPTFAESFEKMAEKDHELTENELRLINDELEKVLAAAEAKDDGWTDSSGRNSHVSNGRISHASSITLSVKPLAIPETTSTGNLACPLQGYLLGSAVECPEKATVPKEHRTSLAELFERHKAEGTSEAKCKQREKREEYKEHDKTTMNLMKKILKKKIVNGSFRSSSASAQTKLFKILHKFQKKVHPECLTSTHKSEKSRKIRIKDMIPCNAGYYKERHTDESMENFSQKAFRYGNPSSFNPMQFVGEGNDSNGSRECWITTDSDYLVLEL